MTWTGSSASELGRGEREQLEMEADPVTSAAPARWQLVSKPMQMGSALLLGGVMLWGPLAGGTAAAAPPIHQLARLRYIGDWTSTASTVLTEESAVPVAEVPAGLTASDQDVRWLHEQSGLTWDQLGRVFGVSRRAVHMWANGGRMNATNAEFLAQLVALVRALPMTDPAQRRAALLVAGPDGRNVIDAARERRVRREQPINGPGFAPDQLLGARHDRPAAGS